MSALHPIADRIRCLIPMLASNQDGEVVAAARTLAKTLGGIGLDLHDFAKLAIKGGALAGLPRPTLAAKDMSYWKAATRFCASNADFLTDREAQFVFSMYLWLATGKEPTAKQANWLTAVIERLTSGEPADQPQNEARSADSGLGGNA